VWFGVMIKTSKEKESIDRHIAERRKEQEAISRSVTGLGIGSLCNRLQRCPPKKMKPKGVNLSMHTILTVFSFKRGKRREGVEQTAKMLKMPDLGPFFVFYLLFLLLSLLLLLYSSSTPFFFLSGFLLSSSLLLLSLLALSFSSRVICRGVSQLARLGGDRQVFGIGGVLCGENPAGGLRDLRSVLSESCQVEKRDFDG